MFVSLLHPCQEPVAGSNQLVFSQQQQRQWGAGTVKLMETQHVLELDTGGVSWTTEEQTLPATVPRLTSCISPASRDKAVGAPEVSEGHEGDVASLG